MDEEMEEALPVAQAPEVDAVEEMEEALPVAQAPEVDAVEEMEEALPVAQAPEVDAVEEMEELVFHPVGGRSIVLPREKVLTEEEVRAYLSNLLFGGEKRFCLRYLFPKESGRRPRRFFIAALMMLLLGPMKKFNIVHIVSCSTFLSKHFLTSITFPNPYSILKLMHVKHCNRIHKLQTCSRDRIQLAYSVHTHRLSQFNSDLLYFFNDLWEELPLRRRD